MIGAAGPELQPEACLVAVAVPLLHREHANREHCANVHRAIERFNSGLLGKSWPLLISALRAEVTLSGQ